MSTPLRQLLTGILFDPAVRAGFAGDPHRYLRDHGWGDIEASDVREALTVLVDDLPVEQAVLVAPTADAIADGPGLAAAAEGLLTATSILDAGIGVTTPEEPSHGADVYGREFDSDLDDLDELADASPDPFDDLDGAVDSAEQGSFAEETTLEVDDGHGAEGLADENNPEDGDGLTEPGEFDHAGFDVQPDLHGLADLLDPFAPAPHDAAHQHDDFDDDLEID
jgi:hypothetical protein